MGAETGIEWTDHTDNLVRGCRKISDGCKHCYAEKLAKLNPKVLGTWGPNGTRPMTPADAWLGRLARYDRAAEKAGRPVRVFINSMWDPGEGAPLPGGGEGDTGPRDGHMEALATIVEAARRFEHLRLQMLTKRPWNLVQWWETARMWDQEPWPERLWVGVSVEDQDAADTRIPHLLKLPARVRFLSMEPLLGSVDLSEWIERIDHCDDCKDEHEPQREDECPSCGAGGSLISTWGRAQARRYRSGERYDEESTEGRADVEGTSPTISWVIVGGESGHRARPIHPAWARSVRDQCQRAGVPFFFKQWGEWAPASDAERASTTPQPDPGRDVLVRVGKHAAGRLLDGREWSEVPDAR